MDPDGRSGARSHQIDTSRRVDDTPGMRFVVLCLLVLARIAAADGFTLHGTVTGKGKPVADATVTLRGVSVQAMVCKSPYPCKNPPPSPPPIKEPRTATTGADGSFEFPDLPKGNYNVEIAATGWRTVSKPLTLSATREIAIKLQPRR